MNFTHYQKAGDKVFAVNPLLSSDRAIDNDYRKEFNKFQVWQGQQPTIYADAAIKDGVMYNVDELEIVWQMYDDNPGYEEWTTSKNPERDRNNGYITRQYATLKQPVKQEEKGDNWIELDPEQPTEETNLQHFGEYFLALKDGKVRRAFFCDWDTEGIDNTWIISDTEYPLNIATHYQEVIYPQHPNKFPHDNN